MSTQQETPESRLRSVIRDRYHSVRAFCNQYNLPYSTVDNVFKRGVNNVGISTATQLCDLLELDLAAFAKGIIKEAAGSTQSVADSRETELLHSYRELDSYGKELVELVAAKEHKRCADTKVLTPCFGADSWRQYLGAPIACRGGGVTSATEEDARQMECIYKELLGGGEEKGDKDE